ncbi:hypothetical protein VTI74DRAFT_10802 [Chaetomium olivicolor]
MALQCLDVAAQGGIPDLDRLATERIALQWPVNVWTQLPEAGSQILIVLSCEADASRWPSGEKATERTEWLWPFNVWTQLPEAGSQILIVSSSEADASRWPSGVKATERTEWLWPSKVWRHALQSPSTIGFVLIQSGSSTLKNLLIKLPAGANARADAYACSGACSIIHL